MQLDKTKPPSVRPLAHAINLRPSSALHPLNRLLLAKLATGEIFSDIHPVMPCHSRAPAQFHITRHCVCSAQRFIAFCHGSGPFTRLSHALQSTINVKTRSTNRIVEGFGESHANTKGSSSDRGKLNIHRSKSTQAARQLQRLRRRKGQMH